MKRIFCLFSFAFFSFALFAFNGPNHDYFNMKLSAEFGLLNGEINEYVFDENCRNTDNILSRLDWHVLTIPYFEGDLTFNILKYFYLNANGRIGIPTESGKMEDFDWLSHSTPTEYTNYSKHNSQIDYYFNWSVKAGGNIPVMKGLSFTPFLGYKYDYIEIVAYDGYTIYQSNNNIKHYMYGKGITYAQEINSMILGMNIACNLIPKVPIETYFQIVPGLGNLVAVDLHHQRTEEEPEYKEQHPYGLAFLDEYKNIFQLEWKLAVFYELNKYNRLGITSLIQYMPLHKGITGLGPIKSDGSLPDKFQGSPGTLGGAGRFLFSFSVIYQFNL